MANVARRTHRLHSRALPAMPNPHRISITPTQNKSPARGRALGSSQLERALSEMIVHASADDVFLALPSVFHRSVVKDRGSGSGHIADGGDVTEIDMEVFDLSGPVAREHPFGAGARRPACFDLANARGIVDGKGCRAVVIEYAHSGGVTHQTISETAGAVEQQIRRDGYAETAPHGAEPRELFVSRPGTAIHSAVVFGKQR